MSSWSGKRGSAKNFEEMHIFEEKNIEEMHIFEENNLEEMHIFRKIIINHPILLHIYG